MKTLSQKYNCKRAQSFVNTYIWRPGFTDCLSMSRSIGVRMKSKHPLSPNAPHSVLMTTCTNRSNSFEMHSIWKILRYLVVQRGYNENCSWLAAPLLTDPGLQFWGDACTSQVDGDLRLKAAVNEGELWLIAVIGIRPFSEGSRAHSFSVDSSVGLMEWMENYRGRTVWQCIVGRVTRFK